MLRAGDQYVESSGQFRFGFDTPTDAQSDSSPATIQFQPKQAISSKPRVILDVDTWPEDGCVRQELSREEMIDAAVEAEDEMDFETAIDWYRATQASHGPTADICFQIAELLYRCGDLQGARERYYVALELNPDLLEARANLGCVLAEGWSARFGGRRLSKGRSISSLITPTYIFIWLACWTSKVVATRRKIIGVDLLNWLRPVLGQKRPSSA